MPLLGAHESVAGGLYRAFDRIEKVGGESLQIFTRNQRQWNPAPLTDEEISLFKEAHGKSGYIPVASHASYLVNLATNKKELLEKSIASLVLEFERCHGLGIPYVVMHPGSHGGDGIEAGLSRFVAGLDRVYENSGRAVTLLLETTAGQGTGLGSRFEEISYIIEHSEFSRYLGVCVDTCHIFAAGYELRDAVGYARTMTELDESVGLHRVKFFHLNDSKKGLGSRVDRHEHIGHGAIGLEGFKNLLTDQRFNDLPMTLETPKSDSLIEDIENLQTLRSLL
ncbi:deoxyribonuclease IV [Desulforhopalus sp. IMCC35007]|uniref:deoxyribonuclease IV n=1 Tax=Desulforhopalus sp. IMCC35007 TaxID=2569543 RepID=UPI0010ADBBE0|nr:deoxyribonuclease IV [Desulforhopalus sp. IMCC35007]TKB07671.1 deoxyribonuclease IV [Desulforhopalus sp. IMCC35007]